MITMETVAIKIPDDYAKDGMYGLKEYYNELKYEEKEGYLYGHLPYLEEANYLQVTVYPDSVSREEWEEYWKDLTGQIFNYENYHHSLDLYIELKGSVEEKENLINSINEKTIGTHDFIAIYDKDIERYYRDEPDLASIQVSTNKGTVEEKTIRVGKDRENFENVHVEGKWPMKENPDAYITKDYIKVWSEDSIGDDIIQDCNIKIYDGDKTLREQTISIIEEHGTDDEAWRDFLEGYYCHNTYHKIEYDGENIAKDKTVIEKFHCGEWEDVKKGLHEDKYYNLSETFLDDYKGVGVGPQKIYDIESYTKENTYKNGKIISSAITIQKDNAEFVREFPDASDISVEVRKKDESIFVAKYKENKTEFSFLRNGDIESELKIVIEKSENGEVSIASKFTNKTQDKEWECKDIAVGRDAETGELSVREENINKFEQLINMAVSNAKWPNEVNKTIQELDILEEIKQIGNFEDRYTTLETQQFGEKIQDERQEAEHKHNKEAKQMEEQEVSM